MTILFPGRKSPGAGVVGFRDNVVKCIASRVDKRHIIHDYAVSPDNVVFVPSQDESGWDVGNDDWTAYVTLRLYTPDFVEGRKTGNAILHAVWSMYQDGQVRAVPSEEWNSRGPLTHRLPTVYRQKTKFGIEVGVEQDKYERVFSDIDDGASTQVRNPITLSSYASNSSFGVARQADPTIEARNQYMSHHRRVASDPNSITGERPHSSFPVPPPIQPPMGYSNSRLSVPNMPDPSPYFYTGSGQPGRPISQGGQNYGYIQRGGVSNPSLIRGNSNPNFGGQRPVIVRGTSNSSRGGNSNANFRGNQPAGRNPSINRGPQPALKTRPSTLKRKPSNINPHRQMGQPPRRIVKKKDPGCCVIC